MPDILPKQLLTGIPSIDEQHRALLGWARAILGMSTSEANRVVTGRAAQFLIAYTRYHFDAEEYAMVASCYEDLYAHRREHATIRKQLSDLSKEIKANRRDPAKTVKALQSLIQCWVQHHISGTDLAFARYCESEPSVRSVQLPSPKELLDSGAKIANYDQVEFVHLAGEITPEEIEKRLGEN